MPIPSVDERCRFAGRHTLLSSFSANDARGGSRGPPRASEAGGGTVTCDAGVTRMPAVFGLPFDTDTWNSFVQQL